MYKGLDATLLRNVPGSAVYFATYEISREYLGSSTGAILASGGIGGVVFWSSVYPMDVIKSTLQADSVDKLHRRYNNCFDCAKTIFKLQGFRGFWKGFGACIIRSFPVNACSFLAFEHTRSLLIRLSD